MKKSRATIWARLLFEQGLLFEFLRLSSLAGGGHSNHDRVETDPHSHGSLDDEAGPRVEGSHDEMYNQEALLLSKKVKVLCWNLTNPENHETKAVQVQRTWGKRCNKLLFMSSTADPKLPTIALPNVKEGRNFLWGKTKEAFKYVYKHHFAEADWFMKADDDTYVIMENLRFLLKGIDPESPIYYGCKFKPHVKQGYISGGAGYVLSKEALRRFVGDGLPDSKICRQDDGGNEDVELGIPMHGELGRGSWRFSRFSRTLSFPTLPSRALYWSYSC
ncbi:glycoprotein-N-acetylgalactosamine 3-beta-galactosyltransferase 1-like isoform X2 [Folsomia candida]|uniref:Glycoprotein-N-acetylgalactosamine 3-beta-galactosyltransferase 1 n=1 Tax=Folsomia candida TaxID=158441 RepID=A0A226E9F2_FOLCA|nr:glycoprotein-N-acetylgalactosamine 3-beta-galactosyltransferase 1-like isoform X2 [Folsomia candida]OXA53481.1 Glycoprotein-N-acetylgalactosamine 3-beta-galactosyltransferase 1 [Folsomia candida]